MDASQTGMGRALVVWVKKGIGSFDVHRYADGSRLGVR